MWHFRKKIKLQIKKIFTDYPALKLTKVDTDFVFFLLCGVLIKAEDYGNSKTINSFKHFSNTLMVQNPMPFEHFIHRRN